MIKKAILLHGGAPGFTQGRNTREISDQNDESGSPCRLQARDHRTRTHLQGHANWSKSLALPLDRRRMALLTGLM
jgi:hypothetical protein